MPYRADMLVSSFKLTASLFGIGGLWIAQLPSAPDYTSLIEKWGIYGLIIGTLSAVVKMQYTASLTAQKDALAAKDALILAAKETAAIHHETSKELITATYNQTAELVKFNERLMALDGMIRQCPANVQLISRTSPSGAPPDGLFPSTTKRTK